MQERFLYISLFFHTIKQGTVRVQVQSAMHLKNTHNLIAATPSEVMAGKILSVLRRKIKKI